MHVKVKKLNSNGKPLFSSDPSRQSVFAGQLKVQEQRSHPLGRVVITARVLNAIDNSASPVAEIYDAVLLWADEKKMRMRGFEEDLEGVQYGQTWDIEIV